MARVNPYVQDKLASSLGYVPNMDTSGANLAGTIAQDAGNLASGAMQLAVKKQREVDAKRKQLEDINNTLTAYQKSTEAETEMWNMIDKNKQEYVNDPKTAMEVIAGEGQGIINQYIDEAKNSNPAVAEKMTGILTNSFRGKLNEVHTWTLAQDTANAKVKIENMANQCYTMAANTNDATQVLQLLNQFEEEYDENGNPVKDMDVNNLIKYTYGANGAKKIEDIKKGIAEAYILGSLDRGDYNTAKQMLDSDIFDKYLDPETKHKYRNMANGLIKAEEKQQRMDNAMTIFDIKQNAVIKASEGNYSISEAMADNKRIEALGGKPTTTLTSLGIKGEKVQEKAQYDAKRKDVLKDITEDFGKMTKKGKLDPELELKDILEFQNKVEANKQYLTPSEYKSYMTKINEPKIKRIRKMGKNIFGMPQGEMAGRDPYSKGYLSIYNFADKAYAGKDNKHNAINNMITDFVKYAEQLEAKQGREMTQQQAANLANKVIADQRRRTNPSLNNLPKEGRIMKDKNGRTVKMYPDGRYEILK